MGTLSRIVREPFLHFLLLGAVIFAGVHYRHAETSRYRIIVGQRQIEQLSDTYQKQYGRPPEPAQLQSLVDNYIREEILYREGVALNLEQEDQIVRRRVAQKFEFLQLDVGSAAAVEEPAIRRFYETHLADYSIAPKMSFTQVYFSPSESPDARLRALTLLDALRASHAVRAPDRGDRFAGLYDYSSLDAGSLSRVFGDSPVVGAILQAREHEWVGPYQSAYGWHLIYVTAHEPARQLPLREVRDRIVADYRDDQRARGSLAAFARLRSKYVIVRNDSSAG